MTMNCEYDSVVGVILPVENKILPIVHLKLKLTKTHPLFAKNTVAVFMLVVKKAAPPVNSVGFLHPHMIRHLQKKITLLRSFVCYL